MASASPLGRERTVTDTWIESQLSRVLTILEKDKAGGVPAVILLSSVIHSAILDEGASLLT